MKKINVITLGCSKNTVDSEHLMARLAAAGYEVLFDSDRTDAKVVVINTCGFIGDAKQESVDMILRAAAAKNAGKIERLFVIGCLSERYADSLRAELPEVDGFFGARTWDGIARALGAAEDPALATERHLSTPRHYAYLKISEGCNWKCGYCAIPLIRGGHVSVPMEELEEEARKLDLKEWVDTVEQKLGKQQQVVAKEILKEIRSRLHFLNDVGLDYLSLSRSSMSLSGGESQRIRLATQIGSQLVNVLYILDEPSIGLHQRDNDRLIHSLKELRDLGNTVVVVEHDKDMMLESDYVIDIGPKAGRKGGKVVFAGTPEEMLKSGTLTAGYLNGSLKIKVPAKRRKGNGKKLTLKGCSGNNLKDVDLTLPLGALICVTGVSGSGKSTIINETLQPILSQKFYRSLKEPLPYKAIKGIENIDKVVTVDQAPIGKSPRSNPATYTNVFANIRNLFVELPEAKIRGYKPGRFSFNMSGGRCDVCKGNGYRSIEMNFLPNVLVPCEACHGQRYNRETLEVRFKGKSIADVLDMTINQAVEFFENMPSILSKIKVLQDVGLGYIKLGQPSSTLSGGESQRVKLATELSKKDTGKTLFILDEPTTGLNFEDIRILMGVLNKLVDRGNTVLVIEHNLDVIKCADYIVDMGPEGGKNGGKIIAVGTPEEICESKDSITGKFLRKELMNL